MKRFVAIWAAATMLACIAVYASARLAPPPMPSAALQHWALDSLERARRGEAPAAVPAQEASYRAPGPVIVLAWSRGAMQARHVGGPDLVQSVRAAGRRFARDPALSALPGWAPGARNKVRFTISLWGESVRFMHGIPLLSNLGVVPLLEGVSAELGGKLAYLTPDELAAAELYDRVTTPIPDLAFGLSLPGLAKLLGGQLDAAPERVLQEAEIRRFRVGTLSATPYPSSARVSRTALEHAAREGAEFLLRHQQPSGRYTYTYRAGSGRAARSGFYSLPRHAGTTYFLAQADRVLGMPEARSGALRALDWVQQTVLARCGAPERACVRDRDGTADIGSAALTALAASELLRRADDPAVRQMMFDLHAFIRSMQRKDGELMHVYDLTRDRPVDVQEMYYSGEAAYALLHAQEATASREDLVAAQRLMRHLTGAAWSFFGSRYFYGEEHWTCQAVAQAATLAQKDPGMRPLLQEGLDFCLRWLEFQRALQYQHGQTPWPVQGAIGVGPVLLPRLTTVASRVEAGALIYLVAKAQGRDVRALRAQMEKSLGLLLRMRWAPGPVHLLFDPRAAYGGLPATQASLDVRNDFVQHAGSAMLAWAEVLREERGDSR